MSLQPPQPPPVIPRLEEVMFITERHIAEHRRLLDKIITSVTPSTATFQNVLLPLEDLRNAQIGERAMIDAMKYGSPSLEYQKAVEAAQEVYRVYRSSAKRPELYALIQAVQDRKDDLDEESQQMVGRRLLDYTKDGFGKLDDAGIRRVQERYNRIATLSTTFLRTLREEKRGGEWFTPEDVDGVPAEDQEPVGDDGKAFYSYAGKYYTVLKHAHNADTRRRMMEGSKRRCPENVPIFREIILLRDENARDVGATSHAATKLPLRLAESLEWLDAFLRDVTNTLGSVGRVDYESVAAERRRYLKDTGQAVADEEDGALPPWDILYFLGKRPCEKQDDTVKPVQTEIFSEYFPLRHTFKAILAIFADGLQLRFDPLPPDQMTVWHHDVEGWAVWDKRPAHKDEFIGYLFADLLARPHKYKGHQSVNLQPGYIKPDGTRVYSANTLMCSFSPPEEKGYPLTFRGITTLFHELGHSMHDLVSRTRYSQFHGYEVPLELAEGIGMMMEQWCYVPGLLRNLSLHYTRIDPAFEEAWRKENPGKDLPPERIPEEIVDWFVSQRAKNIQLKTSNILVTVLFDMVVHNPPSREALLQLDEGVAYSDCFERAKGRRLPDNTWPQATEYILCSGYDAGYYAYTSAQVLAADFFENTFAADPLSTAAWQKFREGILVPGGSRNCRTLVREYLGGRPMSAKALYSMLGLESTT